MTFSYHSLIVVKPLFFSLSNDRFDGLLIVNSFQCESMFQKQNCHHASFSSDVSKTIPSLSANIVRKGPKFHKIGTNWDSTDYYQRLTLES